MVMTPHNPMQLHQNSMNIADGTGVSSVCHYTSAVRKVSDHFEYLKNRSRDLDVT